jgi:hypothetical protein
MESLDEHITGQERSFEMAIVQMAQRLEIIEATVRKIESMLEGQQAVREWYGISEAAEALGKAEWTVREWCRLGRVNAHKRPCGRGRSQEWILSHSEVERIRSKGLLPMNL